MPQKHTSTLRHLPKPVRIIASRPRLFACLLAGLFLWLLLPADWLGVTRFLAAWNAAILLYLALVGHMMLGASQANIQARARRQDEGQVTILLFSTLAASVSLGAIVLQLAAVKDLAVAAKGWHVALAAFTIVSAFAFIHTMFTLHYAHEYYAQWQHDKAVAPAQRGGLDFPGNATPDYVDFLYFAFIIGVAAQTADVATTNRHMRVIALIHGVIAFFFNTTVLALTINIAAGMI